MLTEHTSTELKWESEKQNLRLSGTILSVTSAQGGNGLTCEKSQYCNSFSRNKQFFPCRGAKIVMLVSRFAQVRVRLRHRRLVLPATTCNWIVPSAIG